MPWPLSLSYAYIACHTKRPQHYLHFQDSWIGNDSSNIERGILHLDLIDLLGIGINSCQHLIKLVGQGLKFGGGIAHGSRQRWGQQMGGEK